MTQEGHEPRRSECVVSMVVDALDSIPKPQCPGGGTRKPAQSKPSRDTGTTASPNNGLQATANSLRSCVAAAIGGA